jgi:hypothetical protein
MKKDELRQMLLGLEMKYKMQSADLAKERHKVQDLTDAVEQMKAHWRPVPITHQWQPKNPQCMFCDDPRESARHQVDAS